MGQIILRGPISGRDYVYRTQGEAPTVDERQEAQALLRQQEMGFAEQYQERFGASALPSRGVGAQVSEFFRGIPRGVGGLFETAALGLATPFGEETELRLREGIRGIGMNLQDRWAPAIGREETVGGRLGEGVGSILGIGGAGLASGLATGNPLVGFGVSMGLGAAAGAGEASERARAFGATQEERNLATRLGVLPGAIEVIPLVRLARVLERGGVLERLRRIALSGGAEGVQEAVSSVAQNLIEQGVYNPEQGTFEGVPEDFGYGAGAGGLVQAILDLAVPGRFRRRVGDGTPPPEAAPEAPETGDQLPPGIAGLLPPPTPPAAAAAPDIINVPPTGPDQISPAPTTPEAQATDTAPTQQAETTAPPEATRTPNAELVKILQELQVPRSAAVSRLVRSGRIQDMAAFRERLAKYAVDSTKPENAARVNQWLQTSREQPAAETTAQPETDARNTTLEPEAKADVAATQETQDAETAPSGPVGPVDAGDRAGTESGIAEPSAGDGTVDADTTGAQPPVGEPVGEPVLVSPESAAPEGAQPGALIGAAPPQPTDMDAEGVRMERGLPPEGEPTPARQYIPGSRVRVDPATLQAASRPFFREGDTQLTDPPSAPAQQTTPEAAAADPLPTTPEQMNAALDDIGVGPRAGVRRQVRDGEITTPEAFMQALGNAKLRGETRQRRDEWLANAREQLRESQSDPAVDRVVNQIEESRQRAEAEQAIAEWFDENASADLRLAEVLAPPLDRDSSPLPSSDLRTILALLQSTKESSSKATAAAAVKYFGRTSDPGLALHMIAHDAAQAKGVKGKRIPKHWDRSSILGRDRDVVAEPLTDGERADLALLNGQGWGTALQAQQWIEANLSPETSALLTSLAEGRATPLRAGYAWINYEDRSTGRDRVRAVETAEERATRERLERQRVERREAMSAEIAAIERLGREQAAREAPAPAPRITLPTAPWDMMAGQYTWPADAHPRVGALIAAGRFGDAVRVLSATAPNITMRNLARRLTSRIEGIQSQVVAPETMNRIRATMSPETPTLGVETPSGVYVHPMSPEAIDAMRREGHNDAAEIVEEFGGQILFNADAPMAPELVMHEAAHAAGDAILTNKSHPLTRQLDKLRTELLKFMPATHYGLSNVREFFAEGMTNPMFRRELSYATAEGRPRSAWQQFKDIVRNWLRGILGMQPVKPETALTALDRALDGVIAVNPNEMLAGSSTGASFAPGGPRRFMESAFARTRVPTLSDLQETRRVLQNQRIPTQWKGALMRLAMPLDYVADAATRYLPSARRVFDLVMQQQAAIQAGSSLVMQTTEQTAKALAKYRRNQSVIDTFNQVLFESTRQQIDPRKPRSAYEGYSYHYNVLDNDGNILRRVESQRYPTEVARNRALQSYNSALTPEQRQNPIARAKVGFNESAETLQEHGRLSALYNSLPDDVRPEVSRMFGLQPEVGRELVEAVRARLEALLPGQRALQDKVFGMIHDKMLSGQLLDPYLGLRRQGQYWLSYSAVDPLSVTTDPATGQQDFSNAQIEQFKHSFQSEAQRDMAIRRLQELGPEHQVNNLDAYENVGSRNARPTVPLEFVAGVLDAIDASDTLSQMRDPTTGQQGVVRQQIIELMFDTLPESSFMNTFKRREGIRGFIGDTTPIDSGMTAGDTVKNLRETAMRISRQATDLRYGAEFSAARKALQDEAEQFQTTNPENLPIEELSRRRAEAELYREILTDYTAVPFRQRAGWSRSLTGGAYMLTLGANVSTALITMSQVPLFVAPFLSGKHGMGRTVSAIGVANRLLANSGRERTVERIGADGKVEQVRVPVRIWDFSLDNYDMSDLINAYLATLHRVAKDNGVFNRSLMQDELLGEQPTLMQRIAGYSGVLQHHAERYSREVALMSSYFLSLQDAMGLQSMPLNQFVQGLQDGSIQPDQAQQIAAAREAVDVSEKTNGPIYAAAGPMMSQGDIGSIAYLFKRHPLSMLNLMYQTATRANPLGTNDPADRRIAQRQFAGMIGMLGAMSGVMGLPMMQQLGWLYDTLFADDDEPDFDAVVRTTLGEAGAYGLVDYFTGMRISERLGLGAAIYRPGFASERLPVPYQLLEGLGGPVVGLGIKYTTRAPRLWSEGEYWRFSEAVAPSALANFLRAIRFGDEGIRTMRGDPIVDDIGPFHLAAQAFGFMPTVYSQRLAMNSMGTRIDNAINTRRSQLLRRRNIALREGDFQTVQRIDGEIAEFNQRHPRNPITRDTLRSSRRAFDDRTARTNYGLAVAPRNRDYIEQLTRQWGAPTAF